jgi:predicted lipoprotein with Yx(FWY)xxD motif
MSRVRVAIAGAILLLLTACGGGGETGGTAAEPTEEMSPAVTTPAQDETDAGATAAGAVEVKVSSTSLGEVLTDGEGRTLYMFDPDKQGDSTCYDQCATAWPPLTVEGEATAGEGVAESMLGTTTRTDGSTQVTYNMWPLYYWQNDKAPGDVAGQAVKGVWWVVGADGEPIRTPPATP